MPPTAQAASFTGNSEKAVVAHALEEEGAAAEAEMVVESADDMMDG